MAKHGAKEQCDLGVFIAAPLGLLHMLHHDAHGFKLWLRSQLRLRCNAENCEKTYLKRPQLQLRCGCEGHRNRNIAAATAVADQNLKP